MVFFDKIKEISKAKGKGKKEKKGYLVCNDCGGYYELKPEESPQDFVACECGGKLEHTTKLETGPVDSQDNKENTNTEEAKDIQENPENTDTEEAKDIQENPKTADTEETNNIENKLDTPVFKEPKTPKIFKSIEIDTTITCPFCGIDNPEHSKYCQDCGKVIAS